MRNLSTQLQTKQQDTGTSGFSTLSRARRSVASHHDPASPKSNKGGSFFKKFKSKLTKNRLVQPETCAELEVHKVG